MTCPECGCEMFISSWEGWRWCCAFCDYQGRVATYEESDDSEKVDDSE